MRRRLAVTMGMALALSAMGARAQGDASAAVPEDFQKLAAANDLDFKGHTPFHLGMTFQLYDLNGKPKGTGSFETWWAAPGSDRTVVHLDGLNEDGSAMEGAGWEVRREAYLVRKLINAALVPVPAIPIAPGTLKAETVNLGKVALDCISPGAGPVPAGLTAMAATACVLPQSEEAVIIRESGGIEMLARPSTGKFHDTYVALDLQVRIMGRTAITGKVTTLQTFDPATSDVKLPAPLAGVGSPLQPAMPKHVVGGVMAGKRVQFVEPEYPAMAKIARLSGTVVFAAVIGKDGSLVNLVPLASTDSMFTEAAFDAVKQWKYSPYELNGVPTEVDTTITVNFALNGR